MWSINSVSQSKTYECLPAGTWRVAITKCEMKHNKAGTGKYVEAVLEVVGESEHAGTQVTYRTTFEHANATAMRIGQENFADFFFAATDPKPFAINPDEDLHKLEGKELIVETVVEQGEYQGKQYEIAVVKNSYSVKGKHRNEKRSLKSVSVGESNAAPVARRDVKASAPASAPASAGRGVTIEDDVPFAPMNW